MSAFDQQDAIYLSSSRQMLEPILEETSEDEEHAQNSWNQYEQTREHFWSSTESETGSVIRVEVNKDPDSISERDFACPAKRARRCDDFIIGGQLSSVAQSANTQTQSQAAQPVSGSYDDTVLLRRTQRPFDFNEANSNSLERFLAYEACTRDSWGQPTQPVVPQRNSTGSRRFDEYSDSDSISYHSLSRSSSLIQFESLERQLQLQEQHASMSSLGNSSPSLLSFDGARSTGALNGEDTRSGGNSGSNSGNNSRRGSQSSLLKRFESSDGRLHQTYFDLDKLNFDDDQRVLFGASKANLMEATVGEVKSDSESSTSSSTSSGNSILTASKPSAEDLTDSSSTAGTRNGRIMAFQRAGKSSAENLSEDSGYCEPSTLRRAKSKSIPKNFEKFCEEEEEFQQYDYTVERHTVEAIDSVTKTVHPQEQAQQPHSKSVLNHNHNINTDVASTNHYVVGHDICQPKINDATFIVATDDETSFSASTTPPPLPKTSPQTPALNGGEDEHEDDVDESDDEERISDTEEAIGSRYVSACPTYEHVKNSPTRGAAAAALLLEQRRSLAHSPSPVASDVSSSSVASASSGSSCGTARSNTSASTCASAASFTWLPTPRQLQQQQQQLQSQLERTQRETPAFAKLELLAAQKRSTLENFCASLRNSLPDIRDALSSKTCDTVNETYFPVLSEKRNCSDVNDAHDTNGHSLEHARSETKTSEHELIDIERSDGGANIATYNLDDSDFSTTSTPASGSASARESHSDETDNESTPEARKRQRVYNNTGGGGGVGCIGATESSVIGGFGGYVSGGRRISSVPSELNKLGRRKRVNTRYRQSKSSPEEEATSETSPSNSGVDEAEDEDFFDTATSYRIRRTCSWSERRERNLQRFEAAFGDRAQREGQRHWASQSLGYMNASYQDLTQLDYSGKQLEADKQRISVQTNLKRCCDYLTSEGEGERDSDSGNMDTPKSTASADYEHIICKGNFLLDELSQIYDRNVSILNDKPIEADEHLLLPTPEDSAERPSCSPRPPPRQRKHSNSSYSDMDSVGGSVGCADEQVAVAQHVQLTIRKPPARQKHARKSEATHSLISDAPLFSSDTSTTNTSSVAYGKTFDQDPTNLHTSYTQSLEKCNFDPKELSNSELNKSNSIPKRRFHSQANAAKQRNMVSSTPNLNAYDPHANDVEDDMYVSSAHTSMHQLPLGATQKPLGILLPAGSRTSFSKEVSFCPVVSQYSWQEQSSEEYGEQHQHPESEHAEGAEKQEDTDDELLDNADATVIQNTRVNEMIAARYAAELKSALAAGNATKSVAQIRAVPIEKVRAMIIVRERQAAEEQERERARLQERPIGLGEHDAQEQVERSHDEEKTSHKATDYSVETKGEALKLDSNDTAAANTADYSETVNAGTAQANVSHKSTIIDATTNVVLTEQTVTVKATSESNVVNDDSDNDAQSNRNSSFSGVSVGAVSGNDNASDSYNSAVSGAEPTRPLSIHLPILSEPPINRAHHILYASQQLLDKFERRESEQYYGQNNGPKCESAIGGVGVGVADRRAKSVGNLSAAQTARYRMPNTTVGVGGQGGSAAAAANNNNELLNKKFKDEKHPSSKGFLSRFAHGLRFSLRRKNKKQLQQQQQQQQQQLQEQQDGGELNGVDKSTMRKSFGKSATLPHIKQQQKAQQQQKQASVQQIKSSTQNNTKRATAQSGPDYIYIPLKGPIPPAGTFPQQQQQQPPSPTTSANGSNSATLPANFSPADAKLAVNKQQKPAATTTAINNNSATNGNAKPATINSNKGGSDKNTMRAITDRNGEPLVTGKPPKPYRYGSIPATTSSTTIITKYFGSGRRQGGGGGVPAHAHKDGNGMPNAANFKSRSQFYTDFLDAERSYYDDDEIEKQLDAGLQANGNAVTATATPTNDAPANVTNTSAVTEVLSQQTGRENNQRDADSSSENASVATATTERKYSVEYETPSAALETAQVAYSLPGVTRETVMLLTTGATGSGVSNAGDGNGRIVAPTYTTMSNAYLQHTNNNNKIGLIETNLDTHETVISGKTRSLVDIVGPQQHQQQYVVVGGAGGGGVAKRLNMSAACGGNADLDEDDDDVRVYGRDVGGRGGGAVVIKSTTANGSQIASVRRPHKSMEFLLDKENQKNVLPPENELQKSHDHNPAALSEHQLRVQASLQRLNIPDWFRQYNQNTSRSPEGNTTAYKPGNFTRKRTTESGRWAGLNSKTTSLSSLGSQRSDRSPLLLSPSAHSHHGGQAAQQHGTAGTSVYSAAGGGGGGAGAFSRWSTSHLNSSQTSPSVSQRGSFTRGGPINSSFISVASGQSSVIRSSYRQPYLGWRSQEKLSQRTPHERLASSLLAQQQRTSPTQRTAGVTANGDNGKLQPVTPEIQSSIKEVTSAIVHYVNDQTQQQQQQQQQRSRSRVQFEVGAKL